MITIKRKVHFVRRDHGRKTVAAAPRPVDSAEPGRVPRISRLMAVAIRFDRLIREGKIADQSELARLAHVTQPRMTQIMNLNHLAPDIQEELLFLCPVMRGRERIHERILRPIVAQADWNLQRQKWSDILLHAYSPSTTTNGFDVILIPHGEEQTAIRAGDDSQCERTRR